MTSLRAVPYQLQQSIMKMAKYNPRLKAAVLEIVENQISEDDPPETRQTMERLVGLGFSREEATLHIGQAVVFEIYEIMANRGDFNLDRYVQNLSKLPKERGDM
jgi:hypothetical protein